MFSKLISIIPPIAKLSAAVMVPEFISTIKNFYSSNSTSLTSNRNDLYLDFFGDLYKEELEFDEDYHFSNNIYELLIRDKGFLNIIDKSTPEGRQALKLLLSLFQNISFLSDIYHEFARLLNKKIDSGFYKDLKEENKEEIKKSIMKVLVGRKNYQRTLFFNAFYRIISRYQSDKYQLKDSKIFELMKKLKDNWTTRYYWYKKGEDGKRYLVKFYDDNDFLNYDDDGFSDKTVIPGSEEYL